MEVGLQQKKVALVAAADASADTKAEVRRALENVGAAVEELDAASRTQSQDFAALVVVGGEGAADGGAQAPDFPGAAAQLVKEMMMTEKPVAAIGTGVALLVKADVVRGLRVAAPSALRPAIEKAGGHWEDTSCRTDGRLVTAVVGSTQASARFADLTRRLADVLAGKATQAVMDRNSEQSFPASDPPPSPTAI